MIDPLSFLALIVLSVGLSQVVCPRNYWQRLLCITAPGVLLLYAIHPLALAFAVICVIASLTVFLAGRFLVQGKIRTLLPYTLLLLLLVPDLASVALASPVLLLGSAFFVIRQMVTVAHGIRKSAPLADFLPALTMSTFTFAALPSGPVFNGMETWPVLKEQRDAQWGEGCFRVFEGFVFLFAVSGLLGLLRSKTVLPPTLPQLEPLAYIAHDMLQPLVAFAMLFATFYGYSRMAEGTALLFGFELPRNFDNPHLARDLGDFWKRWHRSMAGFVMQYIYLPLLVTTSNAKLALIVAFLFMAVWHDLTPGFLIWGLGHGIGLAFLLPWLQQARVSPAFIRISSMVYVIGLSSVAHGEWLP
jgi:D-alanyl-lipoteichoic acid acyltransferase DltB (MBOAT superfamily)